MILQGELLRQTLLQRYVGLDLAARSAKNCASGQLLKITSSITDQSSKTGLLARSFSQTPNSGVMAGPGNILLSRAMMTLSEVQCHLDRQGASNLVVELVIQNPNQNIFLRSVELGIALLEGGNPNIQSSMFNRLTVGNNAERFFKVFFEKMTAAQQTIRSTINVTTTELIGTKRSIEAEAATAGIKSKSASFIYNSSTPLNNQRAGILLTDELKQQISDAASTTTRAYQWIKKLGCSILTTHASIRKKRKDESPAKEGPSIVMTDPDAESDPRGGISIDQDGQTDASDGSITPSKSSSRTFSNITAMPSYDPSNGALGSGEASEDQLPKEVIIMRPILRFLQLLCENHNLELQNFLRHQTNKNNFNMVSETLKFLDCICGSTTGGLGLLGLYINEKNVGLVNQTLETLTEYCQGPCHENQNCIAMHESNAIDIIIALILNDINPLGKTRMDLVLSLKNNASKLLLAIMESRADSGNAERIMFNMNAKQLIEAASNAYHQTLYFKEDSNETASILSRSRATSLHLPDLLTRRSSGPNTEQSGEQETNSSFNSIDNMGDDSDDEDEVTPKEVGHNIYILCHQLARHNKELASLLRPNSLVDPTASMEVNSRFNHALSFYRKHTAQIEIVRSDRTMEQIVFPVPTSCQFLTTESKQKVFFGTERDEQGSKVSDFFAASSDLYNEMKWQRKLRSQSLLYSVSSYMSLWASISFNLQFLINFVIAFFYPFEKASIRTIDPFISLFLWIFVISSFSALVTFKKRPWLHLSLIALLIRCIFSIGIEPSLTLLGISNVLSTGVHLISIMGNRGTFTKSVFEICTDLEIIYHLIFLSFGILGLFLHPFFYSVLLLHVIYSEETLRNVIRSVTRNGRSIILTAILAVILIYLFSIVGYLFFRDDFVMEVDASPFKSINERNVFPEEEESVIDLDEPPSCVMNSSLGLENKTVCSANASTTLHEKRKYLEENNVERVDVEDNGSDDESQKERCCETLLMCIITTLNHGLRNGGGIGDVMRSPSWSEPLFTFRVIYDLLFFFVVIIIILNLIFGVIIDTFADLRSEKQQKEEILRNTCFICGLDRSAFDNKTTSFEEHIRSEHNMWHYLYFIVLVKVKNPTEFTGPESYVFKMIQERNLDWFPRMRALSLDSEKNESMNDDSSNSDQVKMLQSSLEMTQQLVMSLSQQLTELREQVSRIISYFFELN